MDERAVRISIVLASDIRLYRDGLAQMLEEASGVGVVASVGDAQALLREVLRLRPTIVLIDMMMKDAFLVARQIAGVNAGTRIIALGMSEDEKDIIDCARIGVAGYVLREDSASEALEAIRAAARGEVRCSPKIVSLLLSYIARERPPAAVPVASLTTRETQILKLLQDGLSNKMISRDLGIELQTVKNHVHNILGKLAVHRRAEAVSLLRRSGGLLETAAELRLRSAGRR